MPGPIFLGDLARALHALAPVNREEAARIARLLGFEFSTGRPGDGRPPEPGRSPEDLPPRQATAAPLTREAPAPSAAAPDRPAPGRRLTPRRGTGAGALAFTAEDQALAPQPAGAFRRPVAPQAPPLFAPSTERAILAFSLATVEPFGDIDVARVIDGLTFRAPMQNSLPRLPVETLRQGVQVMLDRGPGMAPFYGDQEAMVESLRRVAGRERVRVAAFDSVARLAEAVVPVTAMPVLLLSDLGVGHAPYTPPPLPVAAWLEAVGALERCGAPVLVFFPYPVARCPRELRHRLRLVRWDREATVSTARRSRTGKAGVAR